MNDQATYILLVEDQEPHVELVRRAFETHQERFHLTIAGSAAEARACLAKAVPHLVIADLRLPDGLGTSLLPSDGEEHPFPLIVMTAQGDQAAAVAAMKAGALDYLVKTEAVLSDMPHTAERVLREWRSTIERRTAEEELRQYREHLEKLVEERTAEVKRADEEMALADEVARIVTSTLDINEVYERFALEVKKLVDFDRMNINVIDQDAETSTLKYLIGPARTDNSVGRVNSIQDTENQAVLETGRTLLREDAAEDDRYPSDLEHASNGMHATMRVPLCQPPW